jgi:hypothetical protein
MPSTRAVGRRTWLSSVVLVLGPTLTSCAGRPPAPRHGFGSVHTEVRVDNQMSTSFRLVGVKLSLNGRPIYDRRSDDLAAQHSFLVYDGVLDAGEHELEARLDFRGQGYGVFSYLNGYRFAAKTTQRFELDANRAVVHVMAHERGGPTTPLEERPAVTVRVTSE